MICLRNFATSALIGSNLIAPLMAGSWALVRGPKGDAATSESIPAQWPGTGAKVLWRVPSDNGFSSFAVADGRAFTLELRQVEGTSQEVLVARNADTGAE